MDFRLRKARQGEEKTVYSMISDRVKWMENKGIHQWNDTDYLEVYPLDYYKSCLDNLYVLEETGTGRILSAAVLLDMDDRWGSDDKSIYIHNFVSCVNSNGAGAEFINLLNDIAKEKGIQFLRLDSADDNRRLSSYYEGLGFEPCGVCSEGKYHGILRQKKV